MEHSFLSHKELGNPYSYNYWNNCRCCVVLHRLHIFKKLAPPISKSEKSRFEKVGFYFFTKNRFEIIKLKIMGQEKRTGLSLFNFEGTIDGFFVGFLIRLSIYNLSEKKRVKNNYKKKKKSYLFFTS